LLSGIFLSKIQKLKLDFFLIFNNLKRNINVFSIHISFVDNSQLSVAKPQLSVFVAKLLKLFKLMTPLLACLLT